MESVEQIEERNLAVWLEASGITTETAASGRNSGLPGETFYLPVINPASVRDDTLKLLINSIKSAGGNNVAVSVPSVIKQMYRLNHFFSYNWAGFQTLFDLILFAAGNNLIRTFEVSNKLFLSLPGINISAGKEISVGVLRKRMLGNLCCRLTVSSVRKDICKSAFRIISQIGDNGILLKRLAANVHDTLSAGSLMPPPLEQIYNYLYALFRGHCFSSEEPHFDYYNPVVTGYCLPPNNWDDCFLKVQEIQFTQENFSKKI